MLVIEPVGQCYLAVDSFIVWDCLWGSGWC